MSYRYLVTLKPLEPFFFGGEFTFGADDSRKESSRYSATSTQFPQQTALLGMLRKTMLILNGNLTMHKKGEWVDSKGKNTKDDNYDKAKELVGTESFSYENSINLGIIKSISPLFINQNDNYFIANAKDDGLEFEEIEGDVSFGKGTQKSFYLNGYDVKKHNLSEFISTNGEKKNYSDFFKSVEQIGIKKSKDGETNEDGFFRKRSFYPKDGAKFSFILTLGNPWTWEKETIVSLGGEQSSFKFIIEDEDSKSFETIFQETHKPKQASRIVLASETLVSKEAYENTLFVLGRRQAYRQLIHAKNGKKSKRYYLLERGSVLFSEDIESLEKLLKLEYLQNIGINKYFTLKGDKNV